MLRMPLLNRRSAGAVLTACGALAVTTTPAAAINLVVDYSSDGTSFFTSNPTAKAALDAAAQDVSDAILTSLNATSDTDTGNSGGSTVTFDWSLNYSAPNTATSQTYDPAVVPEDQVTVFAGMRNLTGNVLGQGGPGGIGGSISASYFPSSLQAAMDEAAASANDNLGRGGGPTINTLTGAFEGADYTISYGSTIGSIRFDSDTDNAGGTDSSSTLADFWHFDHTTSVVAGKIDFYTVALHELLHVIGIGTSESWNLMTDGTDWLGANVITLLGSGDNVVDSGTGHVDQSLVGASIYDGASQAAVMTPSISAGERRYLTDVDVAFLADIGWSVIPEPGTVSLMLIGVGTLLWRRRSTPAAV